MIRKNPNSQPLSSFCLNDSSLKTKIALQTFYKVRYPIWTEKLILIFEYLQLLSQMILSSFDSYNGPLYVFRMVVYALKLVNPCYLMDFDSSRSTISGIMAIILFGTLMKLLLFAHVVDSAIRNREMNSWFALLWKYIYKLQVRVLYFTFTSFWVQAIIETRDNGFGLFGMGKSFSIFVSSVMIALEFLFSLMLETQFCYFLPSKSFLSSKNNHLSITTFSQKFIVQIFMMAFSSDSEALTWMIVTFCIILDFTRFYEFFSTFPLHSLEALTFQKSLQSTVFSCSLASFINTALKSGNYEGANLNFVIITWVLLAFFTNKISCEILKFQVLSLLSTNNNEESSPEKLLHKVCLTNELRKDQRTPTAKTTTSRFDHLILMYQNINIKEIFGLDREDFHSHDDDDETIKKIYLLFYQKLFTKSPKNSLLRLYVAHRSFKNSEPYAKIIKLAHGFQKNKWSQNYLSSSLLLYEIEQSMRETQKGSLDLSPYIQSKILVDDVRYFMMKQTDLQIKVCNSMLSDTPDIGTIHRLAQKIDHIKKLIKRKIQKLTHTIPEHYISPYLCFAEYCFVINYSIVDFEKYCGIYTQKRSKVQRFFYEPELIQENLYQDDNAFLLISIQRSVDYGRILYYTKSLENLCGSSRLKEYQSMHISTLFSPSLREYYKNVFKQIEQEGNEQELMNKIHRGYLFHKSGYFIEADFCIKYHPYLNQGLCLKMIIRPVPIVVEDKMDFLLLAENGEIEGASNELVKLLHLPNPTKLKVTVDMISEELFTAHTALRRILEEIENKNLSLRPRSRTTKSQMTYENACGIWSAFTKEEQEIQISPYRQNTSPEQGTAYKFYALIEAQTYGNIKMNLVRLRREVELKSPSISPEKTKFENFESKEREDDSQPILTSPRQLDTETPFMTERTEKKFLIQETLQVPTENISVMKSKLKSNIEHFQAVDLPKNKVPKSLKKNSQKYEENKVFMRSLLSKSYPKSFKILCLTFYLIILVNFGGQIIMKSVSNHTMMNLQMRKNMLEYAQQRAYMGVLLQINSIGSRSQVLRLFTGSGAILNVTTVVPNMQARVNDMREANRRMLDLVYSLDKETQGDLFAADIRVNGTFLENSDNDQLINSFQLTEEVANAVRALNSLSNVYSTAGFYILDYLSKNLINDFMYKSSQIYNLLSNIVNKQKESFQNITTLVFITSPLLLAGVGFLLIFIIWKQSRIEKQNMEAVIKIPSKGIKTISSRLAQFREELINEDTFEKKCLPNIEDDQPNAASVYSKEAETKKIQYKEFRKRYSGHIARVFLCILVLVVIIIWDLVMTRQAIKVIYNRQNQLEFANYISDRVSLLYATVNPLFITNNTMIVSHKYPNETLLTVLEEIKTIQSQIPQKFLEVDGTYNPQVRRILFEKNPHCKGINPTFIVYCFFLLNLGQPVQMITSLSAYHEGMKIVYQDYLTANKSSTETLVKDGLKHVQPMLANFALLSQEAQMIVSITDTSLGNRISEMQNLKNIIITVFSISLFAVSLLIWFSILKVIREVHNDFKKVLQLFPSELVLSSYLLNKFLQETSSN